MTFDDFQESIARMVPVEKAPPGKEAVKVADERLQSIILGAAILCNEVGLNMGDIAKTVKETMEAVYVSEGEH